MTSMTNKRFGTLLQREWMQHQRGWWILMGLPLLVMLLVGIFGSVDVQLDADDNTSVVRTPPALMLALGSLGGMAAVTLGLAWVSSLFQAPGLARRDQQDRSLEFWLSLPVGHVQSLGATLLTHLLLVPWLALAVGAGGGLLVSLVLVTKAWGIGEWLTLPWGAIGLAVVAMLVRLSAGLLLATLWLSPLILMTMAASAWLKRWGLPVVAGTLALAWIGLDKIYGWTFVGDTFKALVNSAGRAFIGSSKTSMTVPSGSEGIEFVRSMPAWAMQDLGGALQALLSPGFLLAIAVAAAGFALLVLRRSRGA
jgi:ABC-2 type transport system permease protein